MLVPGLYGYTHLPQYYDLGATLPKDLPGVVANTKLKDEFDMNSTHILMVNANLPEAKVQEMARQMEDVDGVKWVLGLDTIKGGMVPDDVLPEKLTKNLKNENWQLILIGSKYAVASDEVNAQVDTLKSLAKSYDPQALLIGEAPATKDLIDVTAHDFNAVSWWSIGIIFFIIALVFKSASLPFILILVIFQGITASVGNLGATEENHHIRNIFELSFFIAQWIYGFAAICMYELLNPFVEISFGRNYQFTKEIVLILCINFFVNGMRKAVLTFHDSMGLFWFDRYKALVETILNLVASIILVRTYGIFGVFLATLISTLLTSVWVEPFVIYRERLRTSPWPFYLQYIIYVGIMGGVWFLTDCMCSFATGNIWLIFFERLIICVMVPNLLLLLIYFRKKEFRSLRVRARNIWNRKEQRHGTSVK